MWTLLESLFERAQNFFHLIAAALGSGNAANLLIVVVILAIKIIHNMWREILAWWTKFSTPNHHFCSLLSYLRTVTLAITITKLFLYPLPPLLPSLELLLCVNISTKAEKPPQRPFCVLLPNRFVLLPKCKWISKQFWCEAIHYNWKIILMCVSFLHSTRAAALPAVCCRTLCTFSKQNWMSNIEGGRGKCKFMTYKRK